MKKSIRYLCLDRFLANSIIEFRHTEIFSIRIPWDVKSEGDKVFITGKPRSGSNKEGQKRKI